MEIDIGGFTEAYKQILIYQIYKYYNYKIQYNTQFEY
jgi:hypothetical protein